MESAYKGQDELVTFFLRNKADVNEVGFEGYTALMMSCLGGHEEATRILLGSGVEKQFVVSKKSLFVVRHCSYFFKKKRSGPFYTNSTK